MKTLYKAALAAHQMIRRPAYREIRAVKEVAASLPARRPLPGIMANSVHAVVANAAARATHVEVRGRPRPVAPPTPDEWQCFFI